MDRENVLQQVKDYTLIDDTEMETLIHNQIDNVQDNMICANAYGYDFSWLKKYYEINTIPSYSTGTVAISQDSTTLTGTLTVWTAGMVGRIIRFGSDIEYYRIITVTDTTHIVLQTAYIGSSLTVGTYTIYAVEYPLPSDFKRMDYMKQVTPSNTPIAKINDSDFSRIYPDEFTALSGDPVGYIESGLDSSSLRLIRFTPIQTTRKRVYLSYIRSLPTLNAIGLSSLIPAKYHMLFVYKLSEFTFKLNDMPAKAAEAKADFEAMLYGAVTEDRSAFSDEEDVMASRRNTGYLHTYNLGSNYPSQH